MASDAADAFTFLRENIPQWIGELEEIREHISKKQDEISKVAVTVSQVVRKTGSNETLRPADEDTDIPMVEVSPNVAVSEPPQSPNRRTVNGSKVGQNQILNRKRKTASVLSGNYSGPVKYRSRSMVVIYYDSRIQNSFEKVVRNIGVGRNYLRKGKTAARMEALASSMDESESEDSDGDAALAKITFKARSFNYRSSSGRAGELGRFNKSDGMEAYDLSDKALERAQGQCERGAHQFLRDGDSTDELNGCKKEFEQVYEIAKREVENRKNSLLKKEKNEKKEEQEEKIEQDQPKIAPKLQEPALLPTPPASIQSKPTVDVGPIEVDDGDESSDGEFDLSAIRRPPMRQMSRV